MESHSHIGLHTFFSNILLVKHSFFPSFFIFLHFSYAMSFRPPTQKQPKPTKQARRYRAGQVPENYVDDLSDSESGQESEHEQVEAPQQIRKKRGELTFAQKEINTGVQQTAISDKDVGSDRRLRRLQQAQQSMGDGDGRRRRRQASSDEDEDSDQESDEDEKARERMRMKQRALQQQQMETDDQPEGTLEQQHRRVGQQHEKAEEEEEEEEVVYMSVNSLRRPLY